MRRVAIVVPCFNEERRLDREAFAWFAQAHEPGADLAVEIVFVDDGSTDGTRRVLQSIRDNRPRSFRVVEQQPNQGKAEAVRKGILDALERAPDAVGFWDADLATPLSELPEFVEVLAQRPEVDVVIGSRVKLMGRTIERRPWRHYMGRMFATAASMALELPVYDTQCGAKVFRATPSIARVFAEPFLARWVFDVEILARVLAEHAGPPAAAERSIYELPLRTWIDVGGSKLRSSDFAKAALDLAMIRVRYPRQRPSRA
jgi:glycosyltransferase involved in cell wall biosynthesis